VDQVLPNPNPINAFVAGNMVIKGGNLTNWYLYNQNVWMYFYLDGSSDPDSTRLEVNWYGYIPDEYNTGWNDTTIINWNTPFVTAPAYPATVGPYTFHLCWGLQSGVDYLWCTISRIGGTYFQCPNGYPEGCPP